VLRCEVKMKEERMNFVDIKNLKEKIDVLDILKYYDFKNIQDNGDWVTALCPYHSDRNPSFSIRKSDTYFHCWSCKEHGDVIKLIMDMENVDFNTALDKLKAKLGYTETANQKLEYLREKWLKPEKINEDKKEEIVESPRLHMLNTLASNYFVGEYYNSKARKYLLQRKFKDHAVKKYSLGYHPSDNKFVIHARSKGFSDEELYLGGFQGLADDSMRFKDRLMFPVYTINDQITAFSARALNEENLPKYTGTPNSQYYKKGRFLYGLQFLQ